MRFYWRDESNLCSVQCQQNLICFLPGIFLYIAFVRTSRIWIQLLLFKARTCIVVVRLKLRLRKDTMCIIHNAQCKRALVGPVLYKVYYFRFACLNVNVHDTLFFPLSVMALHCFLADQYSIHIKRWFFFLSEVLRSTIFTMGIIWVICLRFCMQYKHGKKTP